MYRFYNALVWLINQCKLILNVRIWYPTFLRTPQNGTYVRFVVDNYVMNGSYRNGKFCYYPAKYDPSEIQRWCKDDINLLRYKTKKQERVEYDPHIWLFREKTIKYVDGNFVSTATAKALEKNPFHTTLSDKGTQLKNKLEKDRNHNETWRRKLRGNLTEI